MQETNTVIVIPAYNPTIQLVHLVHKLTEETNQPIIVVNDGSTKETIPYFQEIEHQVTILTHPSNKGKGEALKTGLLYVYLHYDDAYGVVTADADGQHKVEDILRVSKELEDNPHALILGCRKFEGKVPFRSKFGNGFTKTIFQIAAGKRVSDTQTGLRAIPYDMIPLFYEMDGSRYEYEMNMLFQAIRNHLTIKEVPIMTVYENNNESSHFRAVKDSLLIYKEILKFSCSSLLSFFIDYGMYVLLLALSHQLLVSNVVARIISASSNYTINKKLVFHSSESTLTSAGKYAVLAIALLVINTAILFLFVDVLGGNQYVCKVFVELLLFIVSLFIQKTYIFQKGKEIASKRKEA
ncbi:MAG: bifunctional glycosyltransferase family 2/GtrA family protein [bacterium]|nr:bifunctional glycosyltransferase family 2/GtrA family protein [bacterium]